MSSMPIVGHGIDIVEVARIARMLEEHGDQFLTRCFTSGERAVGAGGRRYHEHLAARFAAKEAAMKALGTGLADGISWTDCEVEKLSSGAPKLVFYNAALQAAMRLGAKRWHVSISHADTMAVASVILERE